MPGADADDSNSSSSSDSESDTPNYTENEGESSDSEAYVATPSAAKKKHVALFTWACPRSYPRDLEQRKRRKELKPSDVTNAELGTDLQKRYMTAPGVMIVSSSRNCHCCCCRCCR